MFAHSLGAAAGLGYVETPDGRAPHLEGFEIEIAGVRYPATASLRPMFDPANTRIKQ